MMKGLLTVLTFCIIITAAAQTRQGYDNMSFDDRLQSVQMMKNGTDDRYPIISLNSGEKLKLSFDMLGATSEYFQYTIVHCNANWVPTSLRQNEYIRGVMFDNVSDFTFSTNTFVKYVHYNLLLPNDNMKPVIAGNYIVK